MTGLRTLAALRIRELADLAGAQVAEDPVSLPRIVRAVARCVAANAETWPGGHLRLTSLAVVRVAAPEFDRRAATLNDRALWDEVAKSAGRQVAGVLGLTRARFLVNIERADGVARGFVVGVLQPGVPAASYLADEPWSDPSLAPDPRHAPPEPRHAPPDPRHAPPDPRHAAGGVRRHAASGHTQPMALAEPVPARTGGTEFAAFRTGATAYIAEAEAEAEDVDAHAGPVAPPAPALALLIAGAGDGAGAHQPPIPVTAEPALLGSSQPTPYRIADPAVSGGHVHVWVEDGAVAFRDAGSLNGTWTGEIRAQAGRVPVGSEFKIGRTTLRVVATGGPGSGVKEGAAHGA